MPIIRKNKRAMRVLKTFLVFSICFSTTKAQHLKVSDIPQLKVEDFKAKAPKDNPYWAYTSYKILYRLDSVIHIAHNKVKLKFITKVDVLNDHNYFNLEKIPADRISSVLNHEQGHVLIGFIIANKLEELLSAKVWSDNFREEVGKEYGKQLAKYAKLNERYDEATKHGMDDVMQSKWDKELQALFGVN